MIMQFGRISDNFDIVFFLFLPLGSYANVF